MFIINGNYWRITLVSADHPTLMRSDGSVTIGCCDDIDKTIYINRNLGRRMFKKVLCHELTHAAMFSYGIDMDIWQEEIVADLIATYGQEIIDITNELFCDIKGC